MRAILITILLLLGVLMALAMSIDWKKLYISPFVLKKLSSKERQRPDVQVASNITNIYRLIQMEILEIVGVSSIILIQIYPWHVSLIVIICAVWVAWLVSSFKFVREAGSWLVVRLYKPLVWASQNCDFVLRYMHGFPLGESIEFSSVEELIETVSASEVLSSGEKRTLSYSLKFKSKTAESIMVPIDSLMVVKKQTTITPKLLDELNSSGQLWFPVVDKTLNSPVGVLYLNDLRDISLLETNPKASAIMWTDMYFIHRKADLQAAFDIFKATQSSQLFVISDDGKTVGVLSTVKLLIEGMGLRADTDITAEDYDNPTDVLNNFIKTSDI